MALRPASLTCVVEIMSHPLDFFDGKFWLSWPEIKIPKEYFFSCRECSHCGRLSTKPSLAADITDTMSAFKPLMHRRVSVDFFELCSLTIPRRRRTFRKPTRNFRYLIRAHRYFNLWLATFNKCRSCPVYTYAVSFSDWALLCLVTDLTSAGAWNTLGSIRAVAS